MKIWYHGTDSLDKVRSIVKKGFNEGTWFAAHLEDAIEFGGEYVLFVDIKFNTRKWQVCSARSISPFLIVKIIHYQRSYPFGDAAQYIHKRRGVKNEK